MKKYKYNELFGKICAKYGTIRAFAQDLGKTPDTVTAKLTGKSSWKDAERERTCELLGINEDEVARYFLVAKCLEKNTSIAKSVV